jgi:hypothetical protein
MTKIPAIETSYAGCRFRSRLEARWAVFFDHLGLQWEYEPERYPVGPPTDRRTYLPDFWLPGLELWVEIKGVPTDWDVQTLYYAATPAIADGSALRDPNLGLPGRDEGQRLLLLGNIPRVQPGWTVWQHSLAYKDPHETDSGLNADFGLYTRLFFFDEDAGVVDAEEWGIAVDRADRRDASIWQFNAFVSDDPMPRRWGGLARKVADAYVAARSARFEHGQQG